MSFSSQNTIVKREEAILDIFSLPPSEPNQLMSASGVAKTFNITAQPQARSRGLASTTWNGRYPDGEEFTWKEPAPAKSQVPKYNHIKAWGLDPNTSTPTADRVEEWKKDFNRDLEGRHKANQSPTEAKCESIFRTWESNHASNRYDSDFPYTKIEGLQDWEMECALMGDWKRLDHMLIGEQEAGEPEHFKPNLEFKLEWKLAVKVFRLKAAHDKARKIADFEHKLGGGTVPYTHLVDQNLAAIQRDEKNRGKQRRAAPKSKPAPKPRASRPQTKPSAKEGTSESLKRKRDDSEATIEACSSSSPTPPASQACEHAPGPALRRTTRQRKPKLHLDELNVPAPRPPITNEEPTSHEPLTLKVRLFSRCQSQSPPPLPPPPPPPPSPQKNITLKLLLSS